MINYIKENSYIVINFTVWYTYKSKKEEDEVGVFEYRTNIRYQDINEKNELSDKGILNILSEAAGAHSGKVRI